MLRPLIYWSPYMKACCLQCSTPSVIHLVHPVTSSSMQACYIPVHPLTAAGVIVPYSCKEGPALGQLPLIAVWGTIQIIMTVISDIERVSSKTAPR